MRETSCQMEHYEDYNRERTRQCLRKAEFECSYCKRQICAECADVHWHQSTFETKSRIKEPK